MKLWRAWYFKAGPNWHEIQVVVMADTKEEAHRYIALKYKNNKLEFCDYEEIVLHEHCHIFEMHNSMQR